MRGVRQVTGETPRCARVALLARLNDVVVAEVRAGIGNGQDVVRAVAIVALRRFRVPELRDFSVVRVEVRLGDLLVAASALRHDLELESLRVGAANLVRGVVVVAHGQFLPRLRHRR